MIMYYYYYYTIGYLSFASNLSEQTSYADFKTMVMAKITILAITIVNLRKIVFVFTFRG